MVTTLVMIVLHCLIQFYVITDEKDVATLIDLVRLLPPGIKRGKKSWRPSSIESRDGFIKTVSVRVYKIKIL